MSAVESARPGYRGNVDDSTNCVGVKESGGRYYLIVRCGKCPAWISGERRRFDELRWSQGKRSGADNAPVPPVPVAPPAPPAAGRAHLCRRRTGEPLAPTTRRCRRYRSPRRPRRPPAAPTCAAGAPANPAWITTLASNKIPRSYSLGSVTASRAEATLSPSSLLGLRPSHPIRSPVVTASVR